MKEKTCRRKIFGRWKRYLFLERKNEEGKGGKYLEKDNIFFLVEERKKRRKRRKIKEKKENRYLQRRRSTKREKRKVFGEKKLS